MLGKLMKHDIKNMGKLLLPLNVIVLLMGLTGAVLHTTGLFDLENVGPLLGILITTYVTGMAVIMVISYFYPIVYFYRNLFTRQGYLTFTLPVSPWKILLSKTIVGFGWYLVNVITAFLSLWATTGFMRISGEFMINFYVDFGQEIGMSFNLLSLWLIGITITSLLWSLITAYFSISIGQLFGKHKIIASVGAYIVIYTVIQILLTAMFIPFLLSAPGVHRMVSVTFNGTIIASVVFSVLFYVLSGVIMKKKVNLD